MHTKTNVEFYIGRDGDFDILAASIIKRIQKRVGDENSQITLVLPYVKKGIEYYEQYYSRIVIPDHLQTAHPKSRITKRNQWMVKECDLLVCYVEHEHGGAYTAMKYAQRLDKKIINLAINEYQISDSP